MTMIWLTVVIEFDNVPNFKANKAKEINGNAQTANFTDDIQTILPEINPVQAKKKRGTFYN